MWHRIVANRKHSVVLGFQLLRGVVSVISFHDADCGNPKPAVLGPRSPIIYQQQSAKLLPGTFYRYI
jgi:hypothetical protein